MYIWVACDLSDPLGKVREDCLYLNRDIGADEVAFTLPQHVSLKISFRIDDIFFESAVADIGEYFEKAEPFCLASPTLELSGNIIWLRFADEEPLVRMHRALDAMMLQKYGVPQHAFDKCFAFHSTLFIDNDSEKLGRVYNEIAKISLPEKIMVDSFIIGTSESGKAGEYRVIDNISIKK